MSLHTGSTFAGFRVVQLLGSGGMGEVYLVEHPRLPRLEALKILPASASQDPDYRGRFDREAELASSLWHPNIVALHDRGEADGQLWISMDYVRGRDAADLADGHSGGLPLADAAAIASAIASALGYAHSKGMLHRDVKPANILLGESDHGEQRILLADFGIARRTGDVSGLTATNTTVGTVAYAAPEQLLGEQLDGRADQYALAATVFHLLTGRPPFVDTNPAVVIGRHLSAIPPRLSQFRPDLAHLDPVFDRALAKTPADRFPRCADFAQALAGANGPGTAGVTPPTAREHATVLSPVVAMAQAPTQFAVPAGVPERATSASGARAALVALVVLVVLVAGAGAFAVSQWLRPAPPAAATEAAQWQPYVDFAKTFSERLMSMGPQFGDTNADWVIRHSTGEFHDDFSEQRDSFVHLLTSSGVTTAATVNAVALRSFDQGAGSAVVLVAATAESTDREGVAHDPRSYRLMLTVEQVGSVLKTSKAEFVS